LALNVALYMSFEANALTVGWIVGATLAVMIGIWHWRHRNDRRRAPVTIGSAFDAKAFYKRDTR
jgi:hypothetical protein